MMNDELKIDERIEDCEQEISEFQDAEAVGGTQFESSTDTGTWFKYDESKPKSAEVCLRTMTLEEVQEMRKLFIKKKAVYKKGGRFEFEETNSDGQNEYIWKKCIVIWRGVLDGNNNVRPCDDEQKLYLMYKVPAFFNWVTRCMTKLNDIEVEAEEVEIKN